MAKEHCPVCDSELGRLDPYGGVESFAKLRTCSNENCDAQYAYVDGPGGPCSARLSVPVRPSRLEV